MMNNMPSFTPPVDSYPVQDNDIIQKAKDELGVGSDIVTSAAMAETLLEANKDKAKPENVKVPELPVELVKDEKIVGEQVKPQEIPTDVAGLNKRMTDIESRLSNLESKVNTMGTLPDIKTVLEQAEKDKEAEDKETEDKETEDKEDSNKDKKKLEREGIPSLHPDTQSTINRDFDERLKYLTTINKELLSIVRKMSGN